MLSPRPLPTTATPADTRGREADFNSDLSRPREAHADPGYIDPAPGPTSHTSAPVSVAPRLSGHTFTTTSAVRTAGGAP